MEKKLKQVGSTSKLPIYNSKENETEQRIGNYIYRLDKIIGQGYSSKVYHGHHIENIED